jgi:hypothetical protein
MGGPQRQAGAHTEGQGGFADATDDWTLMLIFDPWQQGLGGGWLGL